MIEGRRVLLVDDVVTTGATLDAAQTALVEAGPASVQCAAVARAVLHSAALER
jgi:predicted amidophosphoribosyltransferase